MCEYKALHHDKYGYVVKCNRCARLEIGFGSFILSQSLKEFSDFKKVIYENFTAMKLPDDAMPQQKIIQIATPLRNLCWALSPVELKQLVTLLEHASITLEVDKIFHPSDYEN